MKLLIQKLLCFCFLFVFYNNSEAQSHKIILDSLQTEINVPFVLQFRDTSCLINFSQIRSPLFSNKFLDPKNGVTVFNGTKACYWLKFEVTNQSSQPNKWLLNFDNWQYVECYLVDSNLKVTKKVSGHYLPFNERSFKLANHAFIQLNLKKGEYVDCFVRLRSTLEDQVLPENLSFKIYPAFEFEVNEISKVNLIYFFSGIYLVVFLFNLFIYFSTKEKSYLYYLGLLVLLLYALLDNSGYIVQILNNINAFPRINGFVDIVSSTLFGICTIQFTRTFLKIKSTLPLYNKLLNIMLVCFVICSMPAFLGYLFWGYILSSVSGLILIVLVFITALKSYIIKSPSSGLFLLAFGAFIFGAAIYISQQIGLLPLNHFTEYSLQAGSTIEVIVFSLALANRINNLKRENEQKQLEIIDQLNYNNQLQIKLTRELEEKVEERTRELRESQKQLLQKEKLAALGEVVAGVGHEIQNPLNFVNNFSEINQELLAELEGYVVNQNFPSAKEALNNILSNNEKVIFHGKRAEGIVKGMLQHSRTKTEKRTLVNINELLLKYLNISYNAMAEVDDTFKVAIQQMLDTNIETIKLADRDIGSVFLNILNNAFYAVTEKSKLNENAYAPEVCISTRKLDNIIELRIRDNGMGVPKKIIHKVFQPFFTTKPAGVGTGLGLSLSYDIVKAHNGEISISTEEGLFTEFIISLPVA